MIPTSFTLICHMHLVACMCAILYDIRLQLELWWLGSPRQAVKILLLQFRKYPPQKIKLFHSWFCMRNRPKFVATTSAVVRSVEVAKVASIAQGYWPVTTTRLQGSAALHLLGRHSEARSHRCSKSVHSQFPADQLRYLSLSAAAQRAKTLLF